MHEFVYGTQGWHVSFLTKSIFFVDGEKVVGEENWELILSSGEAKLTSLCRMNLF